MTSSHLRLITLTGVLFINACAVGPDYKRPETPLPPKYTATPLEKKTVATPTKLGAAQTFVTNEDIPAQWWKLFHSKHLNELITESLEHNPSVSAAEATLHAALENVYAQRGAFFPFVGASVSPSEVQTAKYLTSVLASNEYIYSLYTGQLFVSYTPDVFGANRRQVESLLAQAENQRLQLEATYLTLTSNVVNAAIQEASIREQIKSTKAIIASQARVLSIYQQQLKLGNVSNTDIATQEVALAATEATLPPLEKQLALQRDLLNALTGRFPDDKRTPSFHLSSFQLPTHLPISLPSSLIEHRPDIRAAEEQMHAANALIGVAVANRLPNVSIGFTNTGTTAPNLSELFTPDSTFWALAGMISQPIFDGGTLLHKHRYAKAIYEQTAAQYRLTIINAFQNVADTLKTIKSDAQALRAARRAQMAALKTLEISYRQRSLGDSSTLTILINEQIYQQAKFNLIQAQANRLTDTVALFQALGGGWWNKYPDKRLPINNLKPQHKP